MNLRMSASHFAHLDPYFGYPIQLNINLKYLSPTFSGILADLGLSLLIARDDTRRLRNIYGLGKMIIKRVNKTPVSLNFCTLRQNRALVVVCSLRPIFS